MRYSKQREEILKVVRQSSDHPDANTIYERSRKIITDISLGTVYRNLDFLSNNGDIKRIIMKDGNDRFDKTTRSHNHIYCEKCGKVVDIGFELSNDELQKIELLTGFKITKSNFKINGLCNDCKKGKD